MLKSFGTSTEPCDTPLLMVYVFDVSLPSCCLKLRFVISPCTNRTICLLGIRRGIFKLIHQCHTVSYAA